MHILIRYLKKAPSVMPRLCRGSILRILKCSCFRSFRKWINVINSNLTSNIKSYQIFADIITLITFGVYIESFQLNKSEKMPVFGELKKVTFSYTDTDTARKNGSLIFHIYRDGKFCPYYVNKVHMESLALKCVCDKCTAIITCPFNHKIGEYNTRGKKAK